MQAVVRVDANPGFEDSVEDALAKREEVRSIVRDKEGNFDLLVLVETADEDTLQRFLDDALHRVSGMSARERVTSPDQALLERLQG